MATTKGMGGSSAARLRMRLNREEGLKALDKVVLDNAYVEGNKFTFEDHEYQVEIIRDTSSRIGVRKCSQVGLSELMVQKCLALGTVLPHSRIIFTLPTKEMAMAFSKDRFDGAIEQSEFYSGLMAPGGNSAGQKKIGDTMLYVAGTFGSKSAISIPAEIIMSDEVDFSNEVVLGKLNSRIRHAKNVDERGNRGYRYRFSTPTVDGYGIDLDFQAGDQRFYMCRCKHCDKFVLPDYFKDFIIPGFDAGILEFRKEDLLNERYDPQSAWIKCSSCGKDLWDSLIDPSRRSWVAKFPDVWDHSYQVFPWDVPKYNPLSSIIKQIGDYPLTSDYINFVIGLPFSDANNTFFSNREHMDKQCILQQWTYLQHLVLSQTVAGMDVGKICHLIVKTKVSARAWHVVWAEKIANTKASPAAPEILKRYDFYRVKKMCIDAGPDISLVNTLVGSRENIVAVVYVNKIDGPLPIAEKAAGDVVNADRTKTLTLVLNDHNSGDLFYPAKQEFKDELTAHLKSTKKIRERNADGDMVERFVKLPSPDHWVHALNYAGIAGLMTEYLLTETRIYAPPGISKVQLGSDVDHSGAVEKEVNHALSGMFGIGKGGDAVRRKLR